jgi:hypothetical protein
VIVDYLRKSAQRICKGADWVIQEFEKEVGPHSWAKIAQYEGKHESKK